MLACMRPMSEDDRPSLMDVQASSYEPDLTETWETFKSIIHNFPIGCWACTIHEKIVGYLLSHPSEYNHPPTLNEEGKRLSQSPDCYYIHDVAVLEEYRGKGIGSLLVKKAVELAQARRFSQMALIAIKGSHVFWAKHGFSPAEAIPPEVQVKLERYGRLATYMRRELVSDFVPSGANELDR